MKTDKMSMIACFGLGMLLGTFMMAVVWSKWVDGKAAELQPVLDACRAGQFIEAQITEEEI